VPTLKTLVRRENFHATTPHRSPPPLNIIQCLPLSFTRPPSSERKIAGQAAAAHARNSKKRQKISTTAEIPDSCSEGGALSGSDSEGIAIDSEPEDDVFVFLSTGQFRLGESRTTAERIFEDQCRQNNTVAMVLFSEEKKPREGNCQIARNLWEPVLWSERKGR